MHVGTLVAQGRAAELRAGGQALARVDTERPDDAARVMRELGLVDVTVEHDRAVGRLGEIAPEKVVAALVQDGVPVVGFVVDMPSLEDLFVALTGEGFNVSG
jgi:ABC-2 type transport system ATP-binding protein